MSISCCAEPDFNTTDAVAVQAMLADGVDLVLLDARSADAFALETIPGAINVPYCTMTPGRLAGLAPEPLYISFCDESVGSTAAAGARKLCAAGFAVKALMGGVDGWKRDGYPTVAGVSPLANAVIAYACQGARS